MKNLVLTLTAAAAMTLVAAPAYATAPDPYVIVAWTINTPGFDGTGDVWGGGGQTAPIALPTSSSDLDQIKASVPCGRWVQVDLYMNDQTTADLLAGGVLYGPSNPAESPADVSPWYIAAWWSGDCAQPDDLLIGGTSEELDCANDRWVIHGWHEVTAYVGDRHGWVPGTPVRTDDPDTFRPTVKGECPTDEPKEACGTSTTLACTPGGEWWWAYVWAALSLAAVGVVLWNPKRILR